MIYDLNTKSFDKLIYDLVIIGSGPAGLSLAYKLIGNGLKVAVMEGGGENFSTESFEQYKGQVIGDKYFDLQYARQRFFGGTSNHWTGWCRPLDEYDFDYKEHQKNASWPIRRSDLDPYLKEASEILEINTNYDDELLNNEFGIKKISFNFSPPVKFGQKYKNIFIEKNLDLFLNSNLVNFTKRDSTIDVAIFNAFNNNSLEVKSKAFVLATGGIENSRLMLALNQKNNYRLFDKDMPIGKYWMEHPHFTIGESVVPFGWENRFLALTSAKQKELNILNCGIRFEGLDKTALRKLVGDISCYAPETGKKLYKMMERNLVCGAKIRAAWEQAPIKNNKITLSSNEKDKFGIPRPILHFMKTDFDKNTVYKTIKQIARYGNSLSYGKIKVFDYVSSLGLYPDEDELAGYHHMGGTRMSDSNRDGVVDRNLKVHGVSNFFITGSSVFPSGGHANPTLTLTQLSLRLGDHIKKNLKRAT